MKVRMTKTMPGSVDGIRVQQYEADAEYDLTASTGATELARVFVTEGWAEVVGAEPAPEEAATEVVAPPARRHRQGARAQPT